LPLWNSGVVKKEGEDLPASYVIYSYKTTIGSKYYPKPDYFGALHYIEIGRQIGVFHLNNIMNGFFPSMIAQFNNGQPDEIGSTDMARDMENRLTGASKAGKIITFYNDSKEQEATFTPFPVTNEDKKYEVLQDTSRENIFIGHRVTSPLIFGIRDAGGLGNNANELTESLAVFTENVINPYREMIISDLTSLLNSVGLIGVVGFDIVESDEIEAPTDAAKESYNGAQISSAIDIIAKVKEGILTPEQAIVFLVQFLNLPQDIAESFFDTQIQTPTLFREKKKICCSVDSQMTDDQEAFFIDYFVGKG
jgi:hypothetical protein